ncbi:hypothetical protein SKAU_G00094880 [Synaphobranchus kaupii]|uniref:Uncharacterized protein n=1 Tax=Synaphobranchus kaupii TaxID=118154 RepID=A0A9Q1FYA6_SYNKA|nr:hypothetical protein SKAU_G00094880 [Synaphobranchus kaupii]
MRQEDEQNHLKLELKANVLYRKVICDGEHHYQFVIPSSHRTRALEGKHKPADRWESKVYLVVKQIEDELPVYVVRPEEDEDGPERTLHRVSFIDLLRPCGFITSLKEGEEHAFEKINWWITRQSAMDMEIADEETEDLDCTGMEDDHGTEQAEEFYFLSASEGLVFTPALSDQPPEAEQLDAEETVVNP